MKKLHLPVPPETKFRYLCWRGILRIRETSVNQHTKKHVSLVETLPAFAIELQRLLTEAGELELAAQVPNLRVFERCSCGDDFCSTFYTRPKPKGSYGPGHRNVVLAPDDGTIILDVVADEIACVEVLDRPDVRDALDAVLPLVQRDK